MTTLTKNKKKAVPLIVIVIVNNNTQPPRQQLQARHLSEARPLHAREHAAAPPPPLLLLLLLLHMSMSVCMRAPCPIVARLFTVMNISAVTSEHTRVKSRIHAHSPAVESASHDPMNSCDTIEPMSTRSVSRQPQPHILAQCPPPPPLPERQQLRRRRRHHRHCHQNQRRLM
jgi:hypothetical protein